jgi:uncharacterized membrane protein YjfL (UPF0719 family)
MQDFGYDIAASVAYGGVALALLVFAWIAIDLLIPAKVGVELLEHRNANVATVLAAGVLAMSIIIASAIHASSGTLADGLVDTLGFGVGGIILQVLGVWIFDLLTPGKLGDVLHGARELHPASITQAAWQVGLGITLAAAIS